MPCPDHPRFHELSSIKLKPSFNGILESLAQIQNRNTGLKLILNKPSFPCFSTTSSLIFFKKEKVNESLALADNKCGGG